MPFQLERTDQDREAPVVVVSYDPRTDTYHVSCVVCGADETSDQPFPESWVLNHWPVHRQAS